MLDLNAIFDPDQADRRLRLRLQEAEQRGSRDGFAVADLPADWHLLWDERAAIMEYDGGLPRERAEALALADVLDQMRRAGTLSGNDACD